VLFLDEFPLFRSDVIEALRQPLESGDVTIARQEESVTLPARGMVVLACNPCPCGNYSAKPGVNWCKCRPPQVRDYRAKVTGPVADRVDIVRNLAPLTQADRGDRFTVPESSTAIRERVQAARLRQAERYVGASWGLNGHAPGPLLRERWPLSEAGQRLVDDRVYDGKLSRRGATRVHRLAWTVADLRRVDAPGVAEVAVALLLRSGEPLLVDMLERAS
jgi:magnesium chelatase family protein